MQDVTESGPGAPRFGWRWLAFALGLQGLALAAATWPSVLSLDSDLPAGYDVYQHLWVMRWYKTCLVEGRSPLFCPELQYPTGAPLGNFSPLHLQALIYLPISLVASNDVLAYNLVWASCLLLSGLGATALAWHVVRDRACAAFAGLLAMLSGPMMIHSHGHTELISVGTFPVFLVAWMRFLDRPTRGRMAAAVASYWLVAMSAAYFLVFAVFPAALYVLAGAWRARKEGGSARSWLRARGAWLAGFAALALPGLALLFAGHIWSMRHGYSQARPWAEFEQYGAPPWSYALPTTAHLLGHVAPFKGWYEAMGEPRAERSAYLGLVALGLLLYAALRRVRARSVGFLWAALAVLVVLSFGASLTIRGVRVSLPAGWLWQVFPPLRQTRVPSRFSLFAGVIAASLAAAGLGDLLRRLPGRGVRAIVFAGLAVAAVADLSTAPYHRHSPDPMPGAYAFLRATDPGAAIVEAPYIGAWGSFLDGKCTYWQSMHRLKTSSGYSGQVNMVQEDRVGHGSPLDVRRLEDPNFLDRLDGLEFGVNGQVEYRSYLWLYLTAHKFDYVVLHHREMAAPEFRVRLDRLKAILVGAKVYEDADTIVYARSRMPRPTEPVQMVLGGLGEHELWYDWNSRLAPASWRVAVYNPDPDRPITLRIDAAAYQRAEAVRLLTAEGHELARWDILPGPYQGVRSPSFRLPAGMHELVVESQRRMIRPGDSRAEARDRERPNHLRLVRVVLESDAPAGRWRPVAGRGSRLDDGLRSPPSASGSFLIHAPADPVRPLLPPREARPGGPG